MPSFAPPLKDFKQPTPGIVQGVIAKFFDLGEVKQLKYQSTTEYELVPQIDLWWQLAEKDDSGKPFYIRQNYRYSEGAKSNLTKFVMNLFGKVPEPGTFDYEKLVGIQRQLVVEAYETAKQKKRVRISTTTPLAPNQAKLIIVPFILPEYAAKLSPAYDKLVKGGVNGLQTLNDLRANAAPITDEDLPF
jgi:hypothetical protein